MKKNSSIALNTLNENGYVLFSEALDPASLLTAKEWISNQIKKPDDIPDELQPIFEEESIDGHQQVRKIRRMSFYDRQFWCKWGKKSGVYEIAKQIVGPNAGLILHAAFLKRPKIGSPISPHQDQALWRRNYPKGLSIWFALDDSTIENGCLEMYPKSHRHGLYDHVDLDGSPWHPGVDVLENNLKNQAIPMKSGDAVAWHRYMVHSSGVNESDKPRMGMVMVFADTSEPDFFSWDLIRLKDQV